MTVNAKDSTAPQDLAELVSSNLKKLIAQEDHLALHSLNPEYPDIQISPELPLRVLGKVMEQGA